jgi:flagellar hook-length control protein FliK
MSAGPVEFSLDAFAIGQASATGPTGVQTAAAPSVPTAPLAQSVAQQIAAHLPSFSREPSTGVIEIALDPPELGRVRLSLVETGGTITLSILSDRPETADLMRRHLDLLAQEFARSGLDAPQVRIGLGGDGGAAFQSRPQGAPSPGTAAGDPSGIASGHVAKAAGPAMAAHRALDLRL